jgi:hypothetical protein
VKAILGIAAFLVLCALVSLPALAFEKRSRATLVLPEDERQPVSRPDEEKPQREEVPR